MNKTFVTSIVIIILSFLIGIYAYQYFPDKIASHWDTNGQVNGYMPKFWGIFLVPIISVVMLLLFTFLPKLDPLKKNYKKFKEYYNSFILMILIFLFYTFLLTIIWNFGIIFNMSLAIIPALGFLFFYIGILLKYLKRNWFIGIRTPWTISNDKVWDKTHKLGSKLFKLSGIIILLGIFFPSYMIWFVLVPVIISSIWLFIYSYLEYKKIKR
jgi:uncharacterized membrane protein